MTDYELHARDMLEREYDERRALLSELADFLPSIAILSLWDAEATLTIARDALLHAQNTRLKHVFRAAILLILIAVPATVNGVSWRVFPGVGSAVFIGLAIASHMIGVRPARERWLQARSVHRIVSERMIATVTALCSTRGKP